MSEEKNGKEISVSQRQIYILSLLSENPKGYQAEEIRQRLHNWDIDVSKRTITRDIDELSLHYGIGEEERGGKTYYFADKYTLKNVDFTIEDLASLAFAKEVLKEYKHLHMGKHATAFIDRIVEQSTALNRLQFDALASHLKQMNGRAVQDHVEESVERQIQNAIENHNKIQIDYYSFSSDEATKRVIHPYRLLLIDVYLCVEAYCELRKEVRRFRLARIHNLQVLDEKYDFLEKEGSDNYKIPSLSKLGGGVTEALELVFSGEAIRYVKEYEANKGKRLVDQEDGLHFFADTPISPDVVRWIRGYGADVRVVTPDWLKNQLLEEAQKRIENNF